MFALLPPDSECMRGLRTNIVLFPFRSVCTRHTCSPHHLATPLGSIKYAIRMGALCGAGISDGGRKTGGNFRRGALIVTFRIGRINPLAE